MPLDAYLEPLGINVSQVYSGIYDLGVVNGRLYMASRDHNHIVLMTNMDALNAEGLDLPPADWTWENFVNDYGPQVTKTNEDGTFEQVAMYLQLDWDPIYIPFMEGWGGKWYEMCIRDRCSNPKDNPVSHSAPIHLTVILKTLKISCTG